MSGSLYVCEMCKRYATAPFKVPVGDIGTSMMREHLRREHGVKA
jgi:hypothetical protein